MPILSDYTKFFKRKWIEALGGVDSDDEYNHVLQVYYIMNNGITPRNIISFINEFVTLKQIFDDSIPERYIAIFILNKEKILKNQEAEIITLDFLGNLKPMYTNDDNISKYIAALVFQIMPDKALDIVYKDKLRQALEKQDTRTAKLISESDVFFDLLVGISPEISNLENAIVTLDFLSKKIASNRDYEKQIWSDIYNKISDQEKTLRIDCNDILKYQLALVRHISRDERVDFITLTLNKIYHSENEFSSIGYYKITKALSNLLKELGEDIGSILDGFECEISVEQYIELVKYAKKDYTNANLRCPLNELDDYLGNRQIGELKELDFVKYLSENEDLESYENLLQKFFLDNINNHQVLPMIIGRLKDINASINIQQIQYAPIINIFSSLKPGDDFRHDLIAMRLALPDRSDANFNNIFLSFITDQNPSDNMITSVANVIQYYITFENLLINLPTMAKYPLYKKVVQYIVKNNKGKRANIITLIKNFEMICEKSEISSELLLKEYNGWLRFLKKDEILKNIETVFSEFFITECMSSEIEIAKYCIEQTKLYLDRFAKEQWESSFLNDSSFGITMPIIIDYSWNQYAIEALQNVLSKIASGELLPNKYLYLKEAINHMVLKKKNIGVLFVSIRDILCQRGDMDIEKFKFFGSFLFQYAKMNNRQESLRTILPPLLLDDIDCINILCEFKDKIPDIVKKSGEENEAFIEGLQTRINNAPDSEILRKIGNVLGIKATPCTT
jgi:hypothetical protein